MCKYVYFILQCGWANASDAIEIMCISFTISSIHDSLHLSNSMLMWLTVVLFLGTSMFANIKYCCIEHQYNDFKILLLI